MKNTELTLKICEKVYKFNQMIDEIDVTYHISFDFNEGKGYCVRFPDNYFSKEHNLVGNNLYINKKSYVNIGFLLNKYKKFFMETKRILAYINDLVDDL